MDGLMNLQDVGTLDEWRCCKELIISALPLEGPYEHVLKTLVPMVLDVAYGYEVFVMHTPLERHRKMCFPTWAELSVDIARLLSQRPAPVPEKLIRDYLDEWYLHKLRYMAEETERIHKNELHNQNNGFFVQMLAIQAKSSFDMLFGIANGWHSYEVDVYLRTALYDLMIMLRSAAEEESKNYSEEG